MMLKLGSRRNLVWAKRILIPLSAFLAVGLIGTWAAQMAPMDGSTGAASKQGTPLGVELAEGECASHMFFNVPAGSPGKETPLASIRVQPPDVEFNVSPVSEGRVLVEGYRDNRKVLVYDVYDSGAGWIPASLERAVSCDDLLIPAHDYDSPAERPAGEPRRECWPDC